MARVRKMAAPEDIGPVRYTQDRLFWEVDKDTLKALKEVWKEGEQLCTETIPDDAIACVTLLAAYGKKQSVDLVDDYDALLQRCRDGMTSCTLHHPDLFFISCICLLAQREDSPTIGGFEQIGITEHYENLIGG